MEVSNGCSQSLSARRPRWTVHRFLTFTETAYTHKEYDEGNWKYGWKAFDLSEYTRLLSTAHPTVPHTEEENERLLMLVEQLDRQAEISPEQKNCLSCCWRSFRNTRGRMRRSGKRVRTIFSVSLCAQTI